MRTTVSDKNALYEKLVVIYKVHGFTSLRTTFLISP